MRQSWDLMIRLPTRLRDTMQAATPYFFANVNTLTSVVYQK